MAIIYDAVYLTSSHQISGVVYHVIITHDASNRNVQGPPAPGHGTSLYRETCMGLECFLVIRYFRSVYKQKLVNMVKI